MRLNKILTMMLTAAIAAGALVGCAKPADGPGAVPDRVAPTGPLPGGEAPAVAVSIDGSAAPTGVIVLHEVPAASTDWLEQALGWQLTFDADRGEGSLTGSGRTLEFALGEQLFSVNGHRTSWAMMLPEQVGEAIYIDLSLAAARMGYRVSWDGAAQTLALERVPENDLVIRTETIEADGAHVGVAVQYPQFEGLANPEAEARINARLAEHGALTLARAEHFDEQYDDPRGMRYLFDLSYEITYNENGVVSLLLHDYAFTGGAHGGTSRYSYTFDLGGHEYSLGDLLGYRPDWLAEASAEIARQFEEREIFQLNEFHGIEPDQPFFIRDGHAVVYFQQYEYTPYAYGFPEFELPWELRFETP